MLYRIGIICTTILNIFVASLTINVRHFICFVNAKLLSDDKHLVDGTVLYDDSVKQGHHSRWYSVKL